MESAWYFRLFFVNFSWFVVSGLLFIIIKAKRMNVIIQSKPWIIVFFASYFVGWVLTLFVSFGINLAFWIGLAVILLGELIYALGFIAMREHPEKKKAVVDWGIYRYSRHSHVLAGIICLLGTIIAGWNPQSIVYICLCIYFVLYVILSHFGVLKEEKQNIERFGHEYKNYMEKTPRYLGIPKSNVKC